MGNFYQKFFKNFCRKVGKHDIFGTIVLCLLNSVAFSIEVARAPTGQAFARPRSGGMAPGRLAPSRKRRRDPPELPEEALVQEGPHEQPQGVPAEAAAACSPPRNQQSSDSARPTRQPSIPPVGASVFHRILKVHGIIAQHASPADFLHQGKVLLRYAVIEKKVQVMKSLWCMAVELDQPRTSPRSSPRPATQRSTASTEEQIPQQRRQSGMASAPAVRPFAASVVIEEEEMVMAAEDLPELAAHERGRATQAKTSSASSVTSTKWGALGLHKTGQTKVSLEQRLEEFPQQALTISATTRGKILFCKCCAKELQNIKETIKTHITSERHKSRLQTWLKKNKGDNQILQFLHEYFKAHPDEKDSTVGEEPQLFRWRVVESCLHAGVPVAKIDTLRDLLERTGNSLSSSTHLGAYIPKIETREFELITSELKEQKLCMIYDGTTRLGECTAVLMRWCSSSFQIEQRLVALRTVKKHMNGDNLGPFLIDIIGQLGVRSSSIVCTARDSCSTNGKAERNIRPILSKATNMRCISHTLSHTAEHVELPVMKDFMTPWLSLVQHHPSAKSLWRERLGGSMKGFSTIRWFSREELCNELAKNFSLLPDFVDELIHDEIGDAHPKKMAEILRTSSKTLQLELACNLDMEPVLKACYTLEGDGLTILLARRKLDELLAWGATVGEEASSMPNVAALLRSQTELTVGTKIYEYFADVIPPRYFKGEIVQPRTEGLYTIKYTDNSKIDQEEREVRQWIDVREMPEWKRLADAAKGGINYLKNRMEGNLPASQRNYDCSQMFEVLRAVRAFDPSWAAHNLDADAVDNLRVISSLEHMVDRLQQQRAAYVAACTDVTIDHTESVDDHPFTNGVLKFFAELGVTATAWSEAARIVFAFTPVSAAAERVFSLLNSMFQDQQTRSLGDYIQTAIMLRYNKRHVG